MLRKLSICLLLLATVIVESKLTVEIYQELIPKEVSGSKSDIEWDFRLSCSASSDDQENVTVTWIKNDEVIQLKERFSFSDDGKVYNLTIKSVTEDDRGIYECKAKAGDQTTSTSSSNLFGLSVPKKMKVTEGEEIKIQCVFLGGPPEILWRINGEAVASNDDERVSLLPDENGTANAIFLLNSSNQNDTGIYTCVGNVTGKIIQKSCDVTVIDPYAALFPFLCICAEVGVLCVLIILYEKRYQKKMGGGSIAKK